MAEEPVEVRYPYGFVALYALNFMSYSAFYCFIGLYLQHLGYGSAAIGSLLAISPFVAVIAQPFWGVVGDRARTKNGVVGILLLGSAVMVVGYYLSRSFGCLLAVTALFTLFQAGIGPLCDAITLEYLTPRGFKFGPIRLAGTVGYAVMAVVAGAFADWNPASIFGLAFLLSLLTIAVVARLPRVRGHQAQGTRVPIWMVFADRELVVLMAFSFIVSITFSFYGTFFPLWYRQIGADNVLVGWAVFIAALSEIPFLLCAERILRKLGTHRILLAAAAVTVLRWLAFYLIGAPYAVLPLQALHGFMYIVVAYSMAVHIDRETPKELKASGQTVYWAVNMGLARIIGIYLGGRLSESFGIGKVFLFSSLLVLAAACVFGAYTAARRRRSIHTGAEIAI